MVDVAELGLKVDSTGAVKATSDLNALTGAAMKAETATENLGDEARSTSAALKGEAAEAKGAENAVRGLGAASNATAGGLDTYSRNIANVGKSSAVARHHVANMTYQINDVAVSLASGQNPMMVFIQQGAQIGQIASQSGAGFGTWARALGLLNPVVLGVAAALGVASGAFAVFLRDTNEAANTDAFVKSLGLTKKELKELGDTSVSVGDMFTGLWRTIDKGLGLSETFGKISKWAVDAFRTALDWGTRAVLGIISAADAMDKTLQMVFANIPAILGDAFFTGANLALKGLNWLANQAIGIINGWIDAVNNILAMTDTKTRLGRISEMGAAEIKNPFKGTIRAIGDYFVLYMNQSYRKSAAGLGGFLGDVQSEATKARDERLRNKAGEIIGDRKSGSAGAKKGENPLNELFRTASSSMAGEGDITKPKSETANVPSWMRRSSDPFREVVPISEVMVDKIAKVRDAFRDLKMAGQETGQAIGDAFYGALTGAEDFFSGLVKGLQRMVAAWIATEAQNVFNSIFKTGADQQSTPISGALDWIGGLFSKNAKGNVYNSPSLSAYSGQVVNRPTMFAFARGAGLMGEAGPEAIMPLSRGRDGKLGVRAAAGGNRAPMRSVAPQVKFDVTGLAEPMQRMFKGLERQINEGINQATSISEENTKRNLPTWMENLDLLGTP